MSEQTDEATAMHFTAFPLGAILFPICWCFFLIALLVTFTPVRDEIRIGGDVWKKQPIQEQVIPGKPATTEQMPN